MRNRFLVLTHVKHAQFEGQYAAYAPYVREMNIWIRQVEEVEVLAPLDTARKVDDGTRRSVEEEVKRQEDKEYGRNRYEENGRKRNIGITYKCLELIFTQIPSFHFLDFRVALKTLIKIPYILYKILGAMRRADHLHLRCPGNIGMLACFCQIFFPGKPKTAKYAGNWDPKAEQPWSYKLQKWLLSNTFLTRNMQVLVYGEWPGQTKNIKSFFTASFSKQEISAVKEKKTFGRQLIFLFVGNLVPGKHPLKAIQLVQEISRHKSRGLTASLSLEIYGDGPERKLLEAYCRNEQLGGLITFRGTRTLEELKEAYQKAHFVILPSQSEGWPKAIAEGMFYGCIPIATPVSCVPWMLDYGRRGILLEEIGQRSKAQSQRPERRDQRSQGRGHGATSNGPAGDVEKIFTLLKNPEEMQRKSRAAKTWSQQYTLEKFEQAIQDVLAHSTEVKPTGKR